MVRTMSMVVEALRSALVEFETLAEGGHVDEASQFSVELRAKELRAALKGTGSGRNPVMQSTQAANEVRADAVLEMDSMNDTWTPEAERHAIQMEEPLTEALHAIVREHVLTEGSDEAKALMVDQMVNQFPAEPTDHIRNFVDSYWQYGINKEA